MHDFEFHAPDSLEGAVALLSVYGDNARVIAGGTALTTMMKQSLVQPEHLISLHKVTDGRHIESRDNVLSIGALATHRDVEMSSIVSAHAPLLAEAYKRVATVRIRNVATVGGGLAHADPAQDPPPSLLLLDANVNLIGASGDRTVPVSQFFKDYYETAIKDGELLKDVTIDMQPKQGKSVYMKFLPRTEDDYATVSVAAIGCIKNGLITDVRLALGAVAPTAIRASSVEAALLGRPPERDVIREAVEQIADLVDPMDDFRGSADYKRSMAVVFARRALEKVLGVSE
jgi:carbon-monoxide dehydrogenase medium subunit